jgi:hypothetical protein
MVNRYSIIVLPMEANSVLFDNLFIEHISFELLTQQIIINALTIKSYYSNHYLSINLIEY